MQGFQTILVLNVCQCSKGTRSVTCKGFKQYQYSMYVSIPNVPISTMQELSNNISTQCMSVFQSHSFCNMHRVSNNISTQCMSEFQRHSLVTCQGFNQYQYSMYVSVPKALISIMQGFQTKLVLNVCQCSKGTHQYHARVSSNISTQYMSVFQRHSSVTCKGFKQYQYSMYVSVPKAVISTMQEFQTILVLNV